MIIIVNTYNIKPPKHKQQSIISKSKESLKTDHNGIISFSLKYLQKDNPKFNTNSKSFEYFNTLIERLKDLSTFKISEFYANGSKSLRAHAIDWDDTCENNFGLNNEEQLVEKPYQFELTQSEHGRVHGFFINESVFCIRWLDPEHNLYKK